MPNKHEILCDNDIFIILIKTLFYMIRNMYILDRINLEKLNEKFLWIFRANFLSIKSTSMFVQNMFFNLKVGRVFTGCMILPLSLRRILGQGGRLGSEGEGICPFRTAELRPRYMEKSPGLSIGTSGFA